MQALKLALRCIIVTQPGHEQLATRLAEHMSLYYRTLTCVVMDKRSTTAAAEARLACVDAHTVRVLFPVCHKALFVELGGSLATELQELASEQRLPAATFTVTERPCNQPVKGTESAPDGCVHPTDDTVAESGDSCQATVELLSGSGTPGITHSGIGWHTSIERIQSWIGVPDTVLQYFTTASLKSLCKGQGTSTFKLQPAQRALLDLATFSAHGVTCFSLQESSASGAALSPVESSVGQSQDSAMLHCTSITTAVHLALHLILHNHCMTQLDLRDVSITDHTARLLAKAVLQSSNSQMESIILSKAPLPCGLLIGRSSLQAHQQPEGLAHHMSNTTVTLSAPVTDSDMVFVTELLEHTPDSPLRSLTFGSMVAVTPRILESCALAVAKLQNLETFQGVSCKCLKGIDGMLCATKVTTGESRSSPDSPFGILGALVSAQVLEQAWASLAHCASDSPKQMNGNSDGTAVDVPCDRQQHGTNSSIHTVNLSGTELGALGSERVALALGHANFFSSIQLRLPCTSPGRQGCKAWGVFISSQVAPCLTSLDLSSNNLDDAQLLELTHSLGLCTRALHPCK